MKNRDKYIVKCNEYDMMCRIIKAMTNGVPCAIKGVSGKTDLNDCKKYDGDCRRCVKEWLNQEAK